MSAAAIALALYAAGFGFYVCDSVRFAQAAEGKFNDFSTVSLICICWPFIELAHVHSIIFRKHFKQ